MPLAFVAQRLTYEAAASADYLQAKVSAGELGRLIPPGSRAAEWFSTFADRIDFGALSASAAGWLGKSVPKFLVDSFTQLLEVAMTFYFLFFILRDRDAAIEATRAYLPLAPEETDRLLSRARDTVRATIFGTVLVALVQGALGGMMFWLLGLPAPLMWGLVMTLLSVIPVLGAFVVWIPAAIFLALEGRLVQAAMLAAWGILVVGTIDNLLRPIVIGDRLGLHTAPAFVAMVGGVIWLGPAGFVVGPVLLALTLCLINILREQFLGTPVPNQSRAPECIAPGERN
jgi:predicted PurR-regulated permease PerM